MARDKGTFFCARSKERRERERPFYVACIERLYSRLGFDTLELMISSSTSINSFPVKERLDPIVFPRVEQLDRVAFPPGDPPNRGAGGRKEPLQLPASRSLTELATRNGYLAERIKRFGSRLISSSSSHLVRLISYHLLALHFFPEIFRSKGRKKRRVLHFVCTIGCLSNFLFLLLLLLPLLSR